MKLKFFMVIAISLRATTSFCQESDYQKIRTSINLASCSTDSTAAFKTHENLMRVDVSKIKKNRDLYYYDLGMNYYAMYLFSRNKEYLFHAITNNDSVRKINAHNYDAEWNNALNYTILKKCEEANKSLDVYLSHRKVAADDSVMLVLIKNRCAVKK